MIVIYHGPNCTDGWTAAWAVKKAHPDATLIPANHGDDPPDVTGQDVVIVDFAYPAAITLDMMRKSKSFLLLDHHKSAYDDLVRGKLGGEIGVILCNEDNKQIILDMTKSGAKLAWEHFHPVEQSRLVDYVSDQDLRKFELPASREINAWIQSFPRTLDNWNFLHAAIKPDSPLDTEVYGRFILQYQEQLIQEAVKNARLVTIPNCRPGRFGWFWDLMNPLPPWTVFATNAAGDFRSEVASRLALAGPFGVCWRQLADGQYAYSLRTHKDFPVKVDLTEVTKQFGGGGHPSAAAFTSKRLIF